MSKSILTKVIPIVASFIPLAVYLIFFTYYSFILIHGLPFIFAAIAIPLVTIVGTLKPIMKGSLLGGFTTFLMSLLIAANVVLYFSLRDAAHGENDFVLPFFDSICVSIFAYFPVIAFFLYMFIRNEMLSSFIPLMGIGGSAIIGLILTLVGNSAGLFYPYLFPAISLAILIPSAFIIGIAIVRIPMIGITGLVGIILNIAVSVTPLLVTYFLFIHGHTDLNLWGDRALPFLFFSVVCLAAGIGIYFQYLTFIVQLGGMVLTGIIWVQFFFFAHYASIYGFYELACGMGLCLLPIFITFVSLIFRRGLLTFIATIISIGASFGIGCALALMNQKSGVLSVISVIIVLVIYLLTFIFVGQASGAVGSKPFGNPLKKPTTTSEWASDIERKVEAHSYLGGWVKCNAYALDPIMVSLVIHVSELKRKDDLVSEAREYIQRLVKNCPYRVVIDEIDFRYH